MMNTTSQQSAIAELTKIYNQGKFSIAIETAEFLLKSYQNSFDIWNILALSCIRIGENEKALLSFKKVVEFNPDYPDAYNNIGYMLQRQGKFEEAIAAYERALAIKPGFAMAQNNLGIVLMEQGDLDQAIAAYERALAIKPDYVEAQWNLSLTLILLGNYKRGWPLYESRITKKINKGKYYIFDKPLWQGEFIEKGTKMLICSEQGFGDFIQFCRYFAMLNNIGAELIVEAPRPLLNLISSLECPMALVEKGDKLPEFDVYCHLMSLPFIFGTTVETIPNRTPYIYADSNKLQTWRDKLGPHGRPRVGLVWSGSAKHSRDRNRSLKLDQLSNLISIHSIEWHSLQKEYREHDQYFLANAPAIFQHQDALRDFSDTAALVECMDLIISVDTSVAHLAGALGKPVWILLPFAPDYRWLLDREDTPWYPTARLFRQSNIGEWQSVIDHVTSQVGQFWF